MKKKFSYLLAGALLLQSMATVSPTFAFTEDIAILSDTDADITFNVEAFIPPEERVDEAPMISIPEAEFLPERIQRGARFVLPIAETTGEWFTVPGVVGGKLKFDKTTGAITDADPGVTSANIPSQIDGVAVTSLEYTAFYDHSKITSVTLPDTITVIQDNVFRDCPYLTSVTLGKNTTSIGDTVFYNTVRLSHIDFGDSLISIGELTFANCDSLTSMTFPKTLEVLGEAAFYHCGQLANVLFAAGSDMIIGDNAFSTCVKLTSINIPSRVKSIGTAAFNNCVSLINVTFEEGIEAIHQAAFMDTKITTLTLPHSLKHTDWAFYNLTTLTSVTLPSDAVAIGEHMFENCIRLASINIPTSVREIGDSAFEGCVSLTQVKIPESVTKLGEGAFQDCIHLVSINIPAGVSVISDYLFSGCLALEAVPISDKITSIGNWAFYRCETISELNIPSSVKTIGSSAFRSMDSLLELSLPDSVTSLGSYAFMDATNLNKIKLSQSIPTIGEGTFYNCSSLSEITIPDSVTTLSNEAFRNAHNLHTISLPANLINAGEDIFRDCDNLGTVLFAGNAAQWRNLEIQLPEFTMLICSGDTDVDVETDWLEIEGIVGGRIKFNKEVGAITDAEFSVTSANIPAQIDGVDVLAITSNAFRGCSNLKSISMPDSITYIGANAFRGCSFLEEVNFSSNLSYLGEWSFAFCDALTSVDIPSQKLTVVQEAAFYACINLRDVVLPNSVVHIDSGAFQYCTDLVNLTLPYELKEITAYAFKGCSSLLSIKFPNNLGKIDRLAFEDCASLESIALPVSIHTIEDDAFKSTAVKTIHYAGSESMWANTKIKLDDAGFSNTAKLLYSSNDPDTVQPPTIWIEVDGIEGGKIEFDTKTGSILDAETTITSANIPSVINGVTVKKIDSYAFSLCNQLTSVTIPSSITAMQNYAFKDCTSLETVTIISTKLDKISLQTTTIVSPEIDAIANLQGVQLIGHGAFWGCSNLKNVTLAESVIKIGNSVFEDCVSLEYLALPPYVTELGSRSFWNCPNLGRIDFGGTQAVWDSFAATTDPHTTVVCNDTVESQFITVNGVIGGGVKFANGVIVDVEDTVTSANIPSQINGEDVVEIGAAAFYNAKLVTDITLPNTITRIGDSAFTNCEALTSITIPASFTTGGVKAFNGCDSLETIYFEGSRAEWNDAGLIAPQNTAIHYGITENWVSLPGIEGGKIKFDFKTGTITDAEETITSAVIPEFIVDGVMLMDGFNTIDVRVNAIANDAFKNCTQLTTLALPIGLQSIGEAAFVNTALETMIIPDSVTQIAPSIVQGNTTIQTIYYGGSLDKWKLFNIDIRDNVVIISDNIGPIDPNEFVRVPGIEGGKIKFNASTGAITAAEDSITIANIPAALNGIAVTTIDPEVFQRNTNLVELTLPDSITTIGKEAFQFCDALTNVTIPASVKSIGDFAFARSKALTEITLQSTDADIDLSTFWNPYIDSTIYFAGTKAEWLAFDTGISVKTAMAFDGNTTADEEWNTLHPVEGILGGGVKFDKGSGTITAAESTITAATIPGQIAGVAVTEIGNSAFRWNFSLTEVVLPNTVTKIGHQAFYDNSDKLKTMLLPDSITSIGEQAFAFCDGLINITLPDSLQILEPNTFYGCTNLSKVKLPSMLVSIGLNAFYNTAIEELAIPASVNKISTSSSLANTTFPESITTIYFAGTEEAWNNLKTRLAATTTVYFEHLGPIDPDDWIAIPGAVDGKIKFNPATGQITAVQHTITSLKIPETINNIAVTSLANNLFIDANTLETVILPKGIQVGADALWANEITVHYAGTAQEWVALNASLPFDASIILESDGPDDLTFSDELQPTYSVMGQNVKFDKNTGTIVSANPLIADGTIPAVVDGIKVTAIGASAFRGNSALTKVTIPQGIESVGASAFAASPNLTTAIIPLLTSAASNIFADCPSLATIYFEGTQAQWSALGISIPSSVQINYERYPISADAWRDVAGIVGGSIKFDEDTGTITDAQDTITTANIPAKINGATVLEIGSGAFENLTALTNVRIPYGVTTISDNAFKGTGLVSIVLPESVTSAAADIFANCENLATIYFGGTEAEWLSLGVSLSSNTIVVYESQGPIDPDAWLTVEGIEGGRIKIDNGVITTAEDGITIANIPEIVNGIRVTAIDSNAFYQHATLVELTIPASITVIESSAFASSPKLTKVTFSEGVTEVKLRAFDKCDSLETLIWPKSLVTVGDAAFDSTPNLSLIYYAGTQAEWDALAVDIPESVTVVVGSTGPIDPNAWIAIEGVVGGQIKFNEATGAITEVEESVTSAVIPEKINGVTVVAIADSAFSKALRISEITLPNTITSIGDRAFENCGNLKEITLPTSLTSIGAYAFHDCDELRELDLPSGITSIGEAAFKNCAYIKTISIPAGVTELAKDLFYSCDRLETIIISGPVTQIADGVFGNLDKLDTIFFGNERNIWNSFDIHVPNDALVIFRTAAATTDPDDPDEVIDPEDLIGPEAWLTVDGIEGGMIQFDSQTGQILATDGAITKAHIPAEINGVAVTSIGNYAFYDRSTLKELSIPDSVTYIGDNAFVNCYSLAEVNIPAGVEYIGDSAFYNCRSLTSISLPESVTQISYRTFYGCSRLESINIPGVTVINSYAFADCHSLDDPALPEGLTFISDFAFAESRGLTTLNIPANVESIGNSAFIGCSNLETLNLNSNLATIGTSAFENCVSLESVDFPANISNIGSNAFAGCLALTEVTLPEGLPDIADGVFSYCNNLATVTIPSTVTSIGDHVFAATALTRLELPAGLTYLGYDVFANIEALEISFLGTAAEWNALGRELPDGVTITTN